MLATPPPSRDVFIQALKSVRITSALFHFVISLGPERVLHFDLVLSVLLQEVSRFIAPHALARACR